MKNNFIVDILEKERILRLHEGAGYKTSIINENFSDKVKLVQKALKSSGENLGTSGPNKDGVDGDYGDLTKNAVMSYQRKKRLGIDGAVGPCTAKSLGVEPLVGSGPCKDPNVKLVKAKSDSLKTTDKLKTDNKKEPYDCIAVNREICSTISPNRQTPIPGGSGSDAEGCASYVKKCMSQYNVLLNGDAWKMFSYQLNSGGSPKYNMYENIDWEKLSDELYKNKVTSSECEYHAKTGIHKDNESNHGGIRDAIKKIMPSKTGISLSDLKLGDIVGIYNPGSTNMGKAFCVRAKERGEFQNDRYELTGKIFTFNTHVGFVGAIKNNQPIIFHNIEGNYFATPAKSMSSNNQNGMISWVISDPDISIKPNVSPEESEPEEKSWLDTIKNLF